MLQDASLRKHEVGKEDCWTVAPLMPQEVGQFVDYG